MKALIALLYEAHRFVITSDTDKLLRYRLMCKYLLDRISSTIDFVDIHFQQISIFLTLDFFQQQCYIFRKAEIAFAPCFIVILTLIRCMPVPRDAG